MLLQDLEKKGLIHPPSWLVDNCHFLTIMGSISYGTSQDDSDFDVYGYCIPKKELLFPHLIGEISGFGKQSKRFEQWVESHVFDQSALGGQGRLYDFSCYNIVKYFNLCMENNPAVIDSLFTPQECILHITQVGNMVRERRHLFLNKGCWARFKGFAYSQLKKMTTKEPQGKRKELREKYGYDVKFAMNVVRLLYEAEMILGEHDLDLRRYKEHLKSIRRGEIEEKEVRRWAAEKEKSLERLYEESTLPWGPDEEKIKKLLIQCLEHHYGSLHNCLVIPSTFEQALRDIKEIIDKINIQ